MAAALVTCTIVLVIILATLVVGISATFLASRYCKFKSELVFVAPEAVPSWEKAVVIQPPPIPPPPPPPPAPPCVWPVVVCPSPPLPPTAPPVNRQKLHRPSGPCHPTQRRNPPRMLQSRSQLPNLIRLPPRQPGKVCKPMPIPLHPLPSPQPVHVFVKSPVPKEIMRLVRPCQPRPTKSAEGLKTPPAPNLIRSLPSKPHWKDFNPIGKVRGRPNTPTIFLLVVPVLVPDVKRTSRVPIVVSVTFAPSAEPGRLQVQPYGGFEITTAQGNPRLPLGTQRPGAVLQRPATNPRQGFWLPPLPMIPSDHGPQAPIVHIYPSREGTPVHPRPVTVIVDIPPAPPPLVLPPPEFHIHFLPDLPMPQLPKSEWPNGQQPQIPSKTRQPEGLPYRPTPPQTTPKPPGPPGPPGPPDPKPPKTEPKTPTRPKSTPPCRRGGQLTSTLGGPWWKKGRKAPLMETSSSPEHYAPFWTEGKAAHEAQAAQVAQAAQGEEERARSTSPQGASSREATPGPGHYDPEHPAVHGRIPGRVPGFPKLRRDPDIRL